MNALIALKRAKNYTDKSLDGLGSVKGSPCTIKSLTEKDNGTEVEFEWIGTSGTSETSSIFITNGTDGNGISRIEKINTVDFVDTYRITFTNGDSFDYEVSNGKDGGGVSDWTEISDKPFESVDSDFEVVDNTLKLSNIVHSLLNANLLDDSEVVFSTGFMSGATKQYINSWCCASKIKVFPGETLYINHSAIKLNLTFFDKNNSLVKSMSVTTGKYNSFNVPNIDRIVYMSIPVQAGEISNFVLSRQPIVGNGMLSDTIYTCTVGDISENNISETISERSTIPTVYQYASLTGDSAQSACWQAYYTNQLNVWMSFFQGFVAIGYISDTMEFLAFSLYNGKSYIINSSNTFTEISIPSLTGLNLKYFSGKLLGLDKTEITKKIPLEKFRIVHGNNELEFIGSDSGLIGSLTYDEINTALSNAGLNYTYADFTPCMGIVAYKNNAKYADGVIVGFSSLSPIKDLISQNPSEEGSQWNGKTWYAYGTSMTDGSISTTMSQLASMSGMKLTNYGLGGSGIIPSLHDSDNIKSRCMRTTDGKTEADLITLEIIPNDMSGTLGTATDTDDTTFLGNLNQILQYLQENTTAQIIVVSTPITRYLYTDLSVQYTPVSEKMTKFIAWVDGTKEVCRRNNVPYIDPSECGLGYYRVYKDNSYVKDQIHLTPLGGYNFAKYMWSRIKDIPTFSTKLT